MEFKKKKTLKKKRNRLIENKLVIARGEVCQGADEWNRWGRLEGTNLQL